MSIDFLNLLTVFLIKLFLKRKKKSLCCWNHMALVFNFKYNVVFKTIDIDKTFFMEITFIPSWLNEREQCVFLIFQLCDSKFTVPLHISLSFFFWNIWRVEYQRNHIFEKWVSNRFIVLRFINKLYSWVLKYLFFEVCVDKKSLIT